MFQASVDGKPIGAPIDLYAADNRPGMQAGLGSVTLSKGRHLIRFTVEWLRNPDAGLENLSWGLTMGQTLSLPLILLGLYLIVTAKGRRTRVEPIAGDQSVA